MWFINTLAVILIFAAWRYRHFGIHLPQVVHKATPFNRELLAQLPRIQQPYRPTPWAYNAHVQLVWLVLSGAVKKLNLPIQRELLTMQDGATTALDWYGDEQADDTPIIVLLHTIGGTRQSMSRLMRDLHQATGWRIVLCLRRGHDSLPLTAPGYNTMGSVPDFREQLAHIKQRHPSSPLYGIGSSAGSGLIVRYLGEEKENSLLDAGIAYCPAYNIEVAFERAHPFYSRKITKDLLDEFIAPQTELLGDDFGTHNANDLAELQSYMHHFSGHASYDDYLTQCNPATVMQHITTPLLVINADDDPVCVRENVEEHLDVVLEMDKTLLVRTQKGSHCTFYEGWRATSWANAVMAEYLLAVHSCSEAAH